MKKYLIVFSSLLIIEIAIILTTAIFRNPFYSIINTLISLPISLIHRSYPYYAEGSALFKLFLIFFNTSIQTFVIIYIFTKLSSKNNLK